MSPDFVRGGIQALNESRMRFVYAYFGSANQAVIDDMKLVKQTLIDPNPMATFAAASHPGLEPSLLPNLQAMADVAEQLDVDLCVHFYENIGERNSHQFEALDRVGALGPSLVCAHAIHLTDDEIAALAARGVRIAHNPLSNMRLASGIIRLP